MRKTVWACVVAAVIVLVRLLTPSIFLFTLTCANPKLALTQGVTILFVVAQFAHATAFANVMRIKVGVQVNYPSFFDLPQKYAAHHRETDCSTCLIVLAYCRRRLRRLHNNHTDYYCAPTVLARRV
jgi:hypothetical protein